jgi:hypothetical protein
MPATEVTTLLSSLVDNRKGKTTKIDRFDEIKEIFEELK